MQKNIEIIIQFHSAEYKKRTKQVPMSHAITTLKGRFSWVFFRIDLLTYVSFHPMSLFTKTWLKSKFRE